MSNPNGWGDGSVNNNIGWGQGANNNTGWGKSHLSSWSGATDVDGGNLPVNSVAPAITGTAQEGQTLTCSTGTWSGSPTYAYQWKRNGSNIGSATNSTYTLVTADVGQSIKCTVTATNFIGSENADSNTVTPTSSIDADAQAFITAAAITDPTQQSAINTLVVDLKGYSIWTKMKAIYPFVGGTATTMKFNLKDPRDLDAAFRLGFVGGGNWSNTGYTPNGTNGYADTKLNARNILTANNASFGIYIPTTHKNISGHGCWNLAVTERCNLLQISGYYSQISSGTTSAYFNSNQNGFIQGSRINATSNKLYRNGSLLATNTTTETAPYPLANFYFSYINNSSGSTDYGSNELRFSYISDGLTDTEAANFYTAVQAFQTTLGRQI